MEQVIPFLIAHGLQILGAVTLILSGLLAIALIIPGDQPDNFLQGVLDFLKKFSSK